MYAQRFADGPRFRPASLGVALAINGGVVAALLLAGPELIPFHEEPPLVIESIPLDTPDPLPTPEPSTAPIARQATDRPDVTRKTLLPPIDDGLVTDLLPARDPVGPGPSATGDAGPRGEPLAPVFVTAEIDPRYARDFQPDYPDTARDVGEEGVVRLRVLIGTDGRVRKAERVSGADIFLRAASRHALARWRFTPATRGGVPEEMWRVMIVRFQLN